MKRLNSSIQIVNMWNGWRLFWVIGVMNDTGIILNTTNFTILRVLIILGLVGLGDRIINESAH